MSLSSTCCPQREFTLRHSLALTPRETSNASSVLRKARWQLTFLFLEVEFLLLRFWRETSNREKNPKGNLSYQIWVTLSCPKACWAPFDREAHRAGFLRWCVLGFLVHVLPGGILGCISCEQTPGGIAGPWSMKGCQGLSSSWSGSGGPWWSRNTNLMKYKGVKSLDPLLCFHDELKIWTVLVNHRGRWCCLGRGNKE